MTSISQSYNLKPVTASDHSDTPRRSLKINALLNHEQDSPKSFPLFSEFQSTTQALTSRAILARPITPFDSSRPTTPLSLTTLSSSSSITTPRTESYSIPSTPITPITPIKENYIINQPISFEELTNVLDFRPLKLKLLKTEPKLLNFDLPTNNSDSGFFTSRFISNPNQFKNRKFQCKICDKRFKTAGHLTRHRKIHNGEKKFTCTFPNCNSKFSRKDNCMQHLRIHKKLKL